VFQMKDTDLRELAKKLESINSSIDLLTKLTALNIAKEEYFRNRERKDEKIEALSNLGIPDKIIAVIIDSSVESVQALRSKMKQKRNLKSSREIEFQADDLQNVLSNSTLFPSTSELKRFAEDILHPSMPFQITYPDSREPTVKEIIRAFQNSDRMKQALFIQALEQRAASHELKDTQFLRFLEGWEAHIKG
jgi:hypothetical protein